VLGLCAIGLELIRIYYRSSYKGEDSASAWQNGLKDKEEKRRNRQGLRAPRNAKRLSSTSLWSHDKTGKVSRTTLTHMTRCDKDIPMKGVG
jgi:hypothetical protein